MENGDPSPLSLSQSSSQTWSLSNKEKVRCSSGSYDPAVIPQERTVNLLALPEESGANYQGDYVLIKVPGLPRPFKCYRTLALV